MKSLAPGVFGLVCAGFIYVQSYNVAIDMLKQMNTLMETAAQQLSDIGSGNSKLLPM